MKSTVTYVKLLLLIIACLFLSPFISNNNSAFGQILFQSSFEGSNPFQGWTNNQSCCSYSVTASTAQAHDGNQSFRSEVRVGDPAVSSGWRAELTNPGGVSDQGDMWYGFSVYFETPQSGGNWTGSYGGHFIQWHPNNSSGSASLSLWGADGVWDVCVNPSGSGSVQHQSGTLKKITANVWHDVVFHVVWGSSGMVEVWIDGALYFTKSGLNWNPSTYLKFGMNRWGNCSGGAPCDTWVIYYDNVKIGRNVTYNDVAPASANPPGNQSPTANAGNDITLTLPANSTTLQGSGNDPDGTIASYAWSRISGPTTYTIANANSATTALSNLVQGTYVFQLKVTDNSGATATDNVTVTVNAAANQSPTANAGNDISITLPTNSATLQGSGSDPDGTIASYAWSRVSGPTTFTIANTNSATTGISNLVQGTYVFRLTVTDNSGATATDNVTVTVNAAANQSPTANAGNDISITLPTNSTTLQGSGSDPDGTIASYAWSRVSGPTTYILANTNSATTGLSNLVQGTYVFRLTVTDNSGATAADNITVTVNAAPNQTPTANAGNNITITLPTNSTTLLGSGSDPDGTIASYAWSRISGPTTFTIANANSATTGLTNLVQGTYVFQLKVTDNNGATATDNVAVTVNAAPVNNLLPTAEAGNNITITLPTNSTTLQGSGSDPDGTIASYAWAMINGPATYTIANTNSATTNITNLVAGTYIFRLTVTDNGGANAADFVAVTVLTVPTSSNNQPPTSNAGNDVTLTLPNNSTTLQGSGSDPDGSIVSYNWTKIAGPGTYTLGNAISATTGLSNLVEGVYVFSLTVTDNNGATATSLVTITVNSAPNQAPTANAGNNITITLPTNSTTLNGTGNDPDGTIASYSWAKISGSGTYTIANANAATTGLSNLVQGVYVFSLTVTDNRGAIAIAYVTVTVNAAPPPPNQPPVANAGSDITITLPVNSTNLNGSSSRDNDGTIISYSWVRVSGPTTYTVATPNTANTNLSNLVQGVYVFRLSVIDNNGASASDNVTVTVNAAAAANQAPKANAGNDLVLTLPTNSTVLYGNASMDPDGTISSYEWKQVSGPTQANPSNSRAVNLTISDLIVGEYMFELKVTDNRGASSTADVRVTVKNKNGEALYTNIYPNPATDVLTLQYMGNIMGEVKITIFDMNKRIVMDEMVTKDQLSLVKNIDVSRFSRGMYVIQAVLPGSLKVWKKFVKQ